MVIIDLPVHNYKKPFIRIDIVAFPAVVGDRESSREKLGFRILILKRQAGSLHRI